MKHRIIEICKNILIVLLVGSLLLLTIAAIPTQSIRSVTWLSRLLQPFAPLMGWNEAELTYVAEAYPVTDAARPIAISIMNDAGRYTAMWDFDRLDAELETFSSYLGQAMDNAKSFHEVSDSQIQAALRTHSVYFAYGAPQQTAVLASWYDSSLSSAIGSVDGCILAVEENTLSLYLLGETSYAASTSISADSLLSILADYEPDGSSFAFETQYALHPLRLISGKRHTVPAVTLSTDLDANSLDALATALGFNPYGEGRYTDDAGTVSFSEDGTSLEVTADGSITYFAQTARFSADSTRPEILAQTAQQFVDTVFDGVTGEGRLYLSRLTQSGSQTVCHFDYYISGVQLVMSQAPVVITFTDHAITQAQVQRYSFISTSKTLYPLPIAQAAALLPEGSKLELTYYIDASGTLSAGWKR